MILLSIKGESTKDNASGKYGYIISKIYECSDVSLGTEELLNNHKKIIKEVHCKFDSEKEAIQELSSLFITESRKLENFNN